MHRVMLRFEPLIHIPYGLFQFREHLFCFPFPFCSVLKFKIIFLDLITSDKVCTLDRMSCILHICRYICMQNLFTNCRALGFSFSLTNFQPICDLRAFSLNQQPQSVYGSHQCKSIISQCERWVDFLTYGLHYQQ